MKHFSFIVLSTILSLAFISCSKNNPESPQSHEEEITSETIMQKRVQNRPSRWDLETLVNDNPNIFGTHVLIFDSIAEANALIVNLLDADPEELRHIYYHMGISNAIIESNIVYDSVMNAFADSLCVDFESDTLTDNTLAWFLGEFVHEMVHMHSGQCIIGEWTNGGSYYSVTPLGHIDERALCNDKNLFIVDGVVFKYSGDYLLTCPAYVYTSLAQYNNLELLQELIEHHEIHGVDVTDCIISQLEEDEDADFTQNSIGRPSLVDDHVRNYTGYNQNNEDKRVKVYISMYPYWSWFHTDFLCKMIISNYYRGTEIKAKIECHFRGRGDGWTNNATPQPLSFWKYRYGLVNGLGFSINPTFKSRTFLDWDYCSTYMPTMRTYVDINFIELSLIQNGGGATGITLQKNEP